MTLVLLSEALICTTRPLVYFQRTMLFNLYIILRTQSDPDNLHENGAPESSCPKHDYTNPELSKLICFPTFNLKTEHFCSENKF